MSETLYEKLKEIIKDLSENELDLIIDLELKLISKHKADVSTTGGKINYAK